MNGCLSSVLASKKWICVSGSALVLAGIWNKKKQSEQDRYTNGVCTLGTWESAPLHRPAQNSVLFRHWVLQVPKYQLVPRYNMETLGANHWAKTREISGESQRNSNFLENPFRGSPLPFGTERRKFSYHLLNSSFQSLISQKHLWEIE